MAEEFRAGPLHDDSYEALEVTEPMQTDSDSCGVFVCRFLGLREQRSPQRCVPDW
ncbi:hypothetical protein F442_04185 [Phytophthora nicotianae P10297]|uniref:Uncharacterized protein n=3 Tax=Phytophthora nicotianae TaxID=4792 RepID=V9FMR8_PHYNI|nr:hypothetical protein F443_04217 [Phytophthora nicotianae P1569]ETO81438.1 hypothetical protein F444_04270 [Phytophthora nicotianae P1976]ETP50562.1 hypothetical protein F442_04185 [Phytophthora nicotianae P10297]